MRKFLLGVLLLPALATAQPVTVEKPVVCDKPKVIFSTIISEEYKEVPFWSGLGETSRFALFVNEKTKTWTFVQFNNQIACVLGTGEGHRPIYTGPKV